MYRSIETTFWTDPKVRGLDYTSKYLFLYFITNPHTHVSGLYYLPLCTMAYESGIPEKKLRYPIDTLSGGYLAHYDDENEIVLVRNMLKYQGRGAKNRESAVKQVEAFNHSPLATILQALLDGENDTLSIPYPGGIPQEQEQEQEQEQKKRVAVSVPVKEITGLYNEVLSDLAECRVPPDDQIKARWKESADYQSTDWWRAFFQKVKQTPFLMGKNDKGWKANLDWLTRSTNFRKVLNGAYESEERPLKNNEPPRPGYLEQSGIDEEYQRRRMKAELAWAKKQDAEAKS